MTRGFGPQVGPFCQDATYLAAARPANDAQKSASDESIDESIAYQMAAGFVFLSVLSSLCLVRTIGYCNPVANLAVLPKDRRNLKLMIFPMESPLVRAPHSLRFQLFIFWLGFPVGRG